MAILREPGAGGVGQWAVISAAASTLGVELTPIDLHDAAGWHRFLALCDAADVLIENLGPEGERRHGLAPAEVRERQAP